MTKNTKFLTVHGHFYQPPRENPWTNAIEIQESASPMHDWNERIYGECYKPNSCSHIFSPKGKISHIVNNYEYLSFNMGPTLLNWIRREHPRTYQRIVEADKNSIKRLGFGNAIAQVYNHIIMPLASPHDRLTQIRWGIKDFEKHFERKPDSIWLAETGINMNTVIDLINEGIRYVILAPSQAWRFRKIGSKTWKGAENSDIDSTRPYRIFPVDEEGNKLCEGHLDVFFYHDHLSRAVSFQGILNSSQNFSDTIYNSFSKTNKPQLINLATDGESYGHHHRHGDMCLSYYFHKLAPYGEVEVVNYSWYLENFPPEYEVQIKNQWGEGTAWSCAHGVGRWYRDCGCQTGGPEEWNQKWRSPLRDALDLLSQQVDKIYFEEVNKLSTADPWLIRDDFIDVLFDYGNPEVHMNFCKKWLSDPSPENCTLFMQLLEMQKFSLYSYTSCGWFFNDIEGLEPTQNLKYARRSIELIKSLNPYDSTEEKFLEILNKATSNEHKLSGGEIYRKWAIPERDVQESIIGAALFSLDLEIEKFAKVVWKFEISGKVIKSENTFKVWSIHLKDNCLLNTEERLLLSFKSEFHEDILILFPAGTQLNKIELPSTNFNSFDDACLFYPSASYITMKTLFPDHIIDLVNQKARESFEEVCAEFRDFPGKYNLFYGLIEQDKVPIPEYISTPLRLSINAEINFYIKEVIERSDFDAMPILEKLIENAHYLKTPPHTAWIEEDIVDFINKWVVEVVEDRNMDHLVQLSNSIHLADILNIAIDKTEIQNYVFPLYKDYLKSSTLERMKEWQAYLKLFDWLEFHV